MQIGELAEATGISRDTLRFYEKRGLLQARRSGNGYRDYPPQAVDWLRYIRTAQALGFTLQEIEADLPLLSAPAGDSAALLRAALQTKLTEIDRRIEGLQALREDLAQRLGAQMEQCPLRPNSASAQPL
jgi:DNA-binding transcriptional MerR regulator